MFYLPADAGKKDCSFTENNGTTVKHVDAKPEETEREIKEQVTVGRTWKGIMWSNI